MKNNESYTSNKKISISSSRKHSLIEESKSNTKDLSSQRNSFIKSKKPTLLDNEERNIFDLADVLKSEIFELNLENKSFFNKIKFICNNLDSIYEVNRPYMISNLLKTIDLLHTFVNKIKAIIDLYKESNKQISSVVIENSGWITSLYIKIHLYYDSNQVSLSSIIEESTSDKDYLFKNKEIGTVFESTIFDFFIYSYIDKPKSFFGIKEYIIEVLIDIVSFFQSNSNTNQVFKRNKYKLSLFVWEFIKDLVNEGNINCDYEKISKLRRIFKYKRSMLDDNNYDNTAVDICYFHFLLLTFLKILHSEEILNDNYDEDYDDNDNDNHHKYINIFERTIYKYIFFYVIKQKTVLNIISNQDEDEDEDEDKDYKYNTSYFSNKYNENHINHINKDKEESFIYDIYNKSNGNLTDYMKNIKEYDLYRSRSEVLSFLINFSINFIIQMKDEQETYFLYERLTEIVNIHKDIRKDKENSINSGSIQLLKFITRSDSNFDSISKYIKDIFNIQSLDSIINKRNTKTKQRSKSKDKKNKSTSKEQSLLIKILNSNKSQLMIMLINQLFYIDKLNKFVFSLVNTEVDIYNHSHIQNNKMILSNLIIENQYLASIYQIYIDSIENISHSISKNKDNLKRTSFKSIHIILPFLIEVLLNNEYDSLDIKTIYNIDNEDMKFLLIKAIFSLTNSLFLIYEKYLYENLKNLIEYVTDRYRKIYDIYSTYILHIIIEYDKLFLLLINKNKQSFFDEYTCFDYSNSSHIEYSNFILSLFNYNSILKFPHSSKEKLLKAIQVLLMKRYYITSQDYSNLVTLFNNTNNNSLILIKTLFDIYFDDELVIKLHDDKELNFIYKLNLLLYQSNKSIVYSNIKLNTNSLTQLVNDKDGNDYKKEVLDCFEYQFPNFSFILFMTMTIDKENSFYIDYINTIKRSYHLSYIIVNEISNMNMTKKTEGDKECKEDKDFSENIEKISNFVYVLYNTYSTTRPMSSNKKKQNKSKIELIPNIKDMFMKRYIHFSNENGYIILLFDLYKIDIHQDKDINNDYNNSNANQQEDNHFYMKYLNYVKIGFNLLPSLSYENKNLSLYLKSKLNHCLFNNHLLYKHIKYTSYTDNSDEEYKLISDIIKNTLPLHGELEFYTKSLFIFGLIINTITSKSLSTQINTKFKSNYIIKYFLNNDIKHIIYSLCGLSIKYDQIRISLLLLLKEIFYYQYKSSYDYVNLNKIIIYLNQCMRYVNEKLPLLLIDLNIDLYMLYIKNKTKSKFKLNFPINSYMKSSIDEQLSLDYRNFNYFSFESLDKINEYSFIWNLINNDSSLYNKILYRMILSGKYSNDNDYNCLISDFYIDSHCRHGFVLVLNDVQKIVDKAIDEYSLIILNISEYIDNKNETNLTNFEYNSNSNSTHHNIIINSLFTYIVKLICAQTELLKTVNFIEISIQILNRSINNSDIIIKIVTDQVNSLFKSIEYYRRKYKLAKTSLLEKEPSVFNSSIRESSISNIKKLEKLHLYKLLSFIIKYYHIDKLPFDLSWNIQIMNILSISNLEIEMFFIKKCMEMMKSHNKHNLDYKSLQIIFTLVVLLKNKSGESHSKEEIRRILYDSSLIMEKYYTRNIDIINNDTVENDIKENLVKNIYKYMIEMFIFHICIYVLVNPNMINKYISNKKNYSFKEVENLITEYLQIAFKSNIFDIIYFKNLLYVIDCSEYNGFKSVLCKFEDTDEENEYSINEAKGNLILKINQILNVVYDKYLKRGGIMNHKHNERLKIKIPYVFSIKSSLLGDVMLLINRDNLIEEMRNDLNSKRKDNHDNKDISIIYNTNNKIIEDNQPTFQNNNIVMNQPNRSNIKKRLDFSFGDENKNEDDDEDESNTNTINIKSNSKNNKKRKSNI